VDRSYTRIEGVSRMTHIIYGLFDPITKELYYVGYTSDQQYRYSRHLLNKTGTKNKRIWISHLKKQNLQPIMEVIEEYQSSAELHDAEEFWYGYFKLIGAELVNDPKYIGAGMIKGVKLSEEHRANMSKARKGRVSNRKGAKLSEDTKKKISAAQKGRKHSEETKQKMSKISRERKVNVGKKASKETKEKLSKAHMGQPGTMTGKKHTEEAKQKIRSFAKGRTWKIINGKRVWMDK
jgi:hypothetical protein